MPPTGGIVVGPTKAEQDFHPSITHFHTTKESASTVHVASHRSFMPCSRQPRTADRPCDREKRGPTNISNIAEEQ